MSDRTLIASGRKAFRLNGATSAIPAYVYRLNRPSLTATTSSSVDRPVRGAVTSTAMLSDACWFASIFSCLHPGGDMKQRRDLPPHCKAPWSASSLIEPLAARCQRLLAGGKSYDSAVQRLDKTTTTVSRTKSRKLASQTRSSGRRRMRNASFRFTGDEFSRSRRHSETYVAHVGSHQCHQELRSFSRRSLRLRRWSCQFKYCKEAFCFIERQKIVVDNNRLRCFKTTSRTTNAGTSR